MSRSGVRRIGFSVFVVVWLASIGVRADTVGVVGGVVGYGGLGVRGVSVGDPFGKEQIVVPRTERGALDFDRAYFSISREQLPGERLYEALDRPDLVERYQHRRRTRRALLGTGIGLLVAGTLIALPTTAVGGVMASSGSRSDVLIGGGATLAASIGVGTVLTVVGALFRSRPLGSRATRRLIDRFNDVHQPDEDR